MRGNDPFLYGEKVKAYLRAGARVLRGSIIIRIRGLAGEGSASARVCRSEEIQLHIFMGNKPSWFVFGDRITLMTEK